jgi:PAS domain S-box-containing protein
MHMQSRPIRVLLIDDDENDCIVVRDLLSDLSSTEFILKRVSDYGAALDAILSGECDVCLLDHRVKERNGLELMQEAVSRGAMTPIVFLTGQGDSDPDLEAMSRGAAYCLPKGELSATLLERSIRHAMERQRKKEAPTKAKRVIQALSECNHSVIHIEDEAELLRAICRIVVDVGGYRMAWVGYAEDDRDQTVTPVAQYGYDEDYLETVQVTWKDTERGRGPIGTCIRTGTPSIIRSVGTQAEFAPWKAEASKRGYASVIGLPLLLHERRLGALAIYSSQPDAFDAEEVEFLVKLSSNLSYGIGVLRLRKAQKQAEESLKEAYFDLETRVEERTAELAKVNAGLRREVEERKRTEAALKEGEQKFRAIFEQTFQLMALLTIEGRVIESNRNSLQFSGIQESDVTGKPFWETPWWTHSTELQETLRGAVKKAAAGGFARFEATHFSADGSLHCMDFSLKPMMDEAGSVAFLIAEARDINERKRTEEALRESEAKYRLISENTGDIIWQFDLQTDQFVYVSPSVHRLVGFTPEEIVGQNMEAVLTPASMQYVRKRLPEVITALNAGDESVRVTTHKLDQLRRDGSVVPIEVVTALLQDAAGRVDRIIGVSRDITERKHAEDVLKESQRQLADIIDFLPDATFVIDGEGKVIAWNRAMEEMTGARAAAMLGKGGYEYALPFYGERRPILIDLVFGPIEAVEAKYSILEKKGSMLAAETYIADLRGWEAYLFCTASALYDSRGNIIGAIESIRNITERKLMEKAVVEAEAKYRDIFEKSVTGIYQITMGGRFLSLNMSIAQILGYDSPEDLLNTLSDAWQLYVHPERRSELLRSIEEQGSAREFEVEYFRKDKSVVWVSLNVRPVRNSTGQIAYMEGTASDITDRKLLKARLDQAQKMEAIGTLAGGIAHDFNNILQPMIGYTEIVLDKLSPSHPLRDDLEQVLNSSLRAKELVRQILAVSRFTPEQERIPIDISSIIKEALKFLRSSLPTSIEIRQDIQTGIALADPTQIHQVLMNLCTNAAHAMDNKGILEIRLSHVDLSKRALTAQSIVDLEPGPYLELCVSDTGDGMDRATLERIFDPYYTTKEVGKGSGLGLAVVRGIVKHHEGTITVRSEPGRGATFSVFIPRADVQSETTMKVNEPLPSGSERILLVDDEPAVVDMGARLLAHIGYKVNSQTDSVNALEVFRSSPDEFDLVITDYTMPKLTGMDFAKEVRRMRPDMPIMLCTGFSEEITPDSVKELGMELLMKPYGLSQISEAVRKILDVRKVG